MMTFKLSGGSKIAMQKTDDLTMGYLQARKKHFRILLFQYGNIVAFQNHRYRVLCLFLVVSW